MATAHWEVRAAQRSIPAEAIDLVLEYGATMHDHRGAEIVYLDKRGKRLIEQDVGRDRIRDLDKMLDVYLVVGRAGIATVGHRYRRVRRP